MVASPSSAGWRIWIGVEEFSRSRVRASKVGAVFGLHVIAYNLVRLGNLLNPGMEAT